MWTQSHPLYGAQLRWERADRHLAEADELLRGWAKECGRYVTGDHHGKIWFPKGWPPLPIQLPVVVGDAVYNLRAVLDYIVYELARLDSGNIQDGTQFIIEDVKVDPIDPKRGFDARSKKYLKGLNQRHISAIEMLQPYNGVEWTKALRDISNPDKHRTLTSLTHEDRKMMITINWSPIGRFSSDSFKVTPEGPIFQRFDVEFDGHNTIAIAPSDASKASLMVTLRELQLGVNQVIELFKSEFKV